MRFEPIAAGEPQHAVVERVAGADVVRDATDRSEHVAGFHTRQLILIAHQQQRGVRRKGSHQGIHQQYVHHAGFIENHQIVRQRRASARPEAVAIGLIAQQPVHRARALRHARADVRRGVHTVET